MSQETVICIGSAVNCDNVVSVVIRLLAWWSGDQVLAETTDLSLHQHIDLL